VPPVDGRHRERRDPGADGVREEPRHGEALHQSRPVPLAVEGHDDRQWAVGGRAGRVRHPVRRGSESRRGHERAPPDGARGPGRLGGRQDGVDEGPTRDRPGRTPASMPSTPAAATTPAPRPPTTTRRRVILMPSGRAARPSGDSPHEE
jgi:hypothetical protein